MKIYVYTLIIGLLTAIGVVYYDPFEWFIEPVEIIKNNEHYDESMKFTQEQGIQIEEIPFTGMKLPGGQIIKLSGSIYKNEEYGFELYISPELENYEIHRSTLVNHQYHIVTVFDIIVPTSESYYNRIGYPITEQYKVGYFPVEHIAIYRIDDYIREIQNELKEYNPDYINWSIAEQLEYYAEHLLHSKYWGYNEKYVYILDYLGGHDAPLDIVNKYFPDGSPNYITTLKIID